MITLILLCFVSVFVAMILWWNLLGEKRQNSELRERNNSLNGMLLLVAQFERHMRNKNYSLALTSMVTIARGVTSNNVFWPGSEFSVLTRNGYIATKTHDMLKEYLRSETNLSSASDIMHGVKQLTARGIHVDTAQMDGVVKRVEKEMVQKLT